jgi:hypothetical protein
MTGDFAAGKALRSGLDVMYYSSWSDRMAPWKFFLNAGYRGMVDDRKASSGIAT